MAGMRLFGETALLAAGFKNPAPKRFTPRILDYVRRLATSVTTRSA